MLETGRLANGALRNGLEGDISIGANPQTFKKRKNLGRGMVQNFGSPKGLFERAYAGIVRIEAKRKIRKAGKIKKRK